MATRRSVRLLLSLAAIVAVGAVAAWAQLRSATEAAAPRVDVVAEFPHDPAAFTQGLAIVDGTLYEGTGQYGRSSLRRVDLATGRVERQRDLGRRYFGEGITVLGDRIYQLTWRAGVGFVYDRDSFELVETFRYPGEGWGLTHDGELLIVSDGSATLRFLEPSGFDEVKRVAVRENGRPLSRLNELEWVDGEIWANVWYEDRIVRIAPDSGEVLGDFDLSHLYPPGERGADDVLNGIAFDPQSGRLFVTGKNWPRLFEIELTGR